MPRPTGICTALNKLWSALLVPCLFCIAISSIIPTPGDAAEDSKGIYLLGTISSMAAVIPPPGTYYGHLNLYYDADATVPASNSIPLRELGNLTTQADIDLNVKFFASVPVPQWVAPRKVLGGSFGLGTIIPIGWQDIGVDVSVLQQLTLPDGQTFQRGGDFGLTDDTFSFGDPQPFMFIGWTHGSWHWKLASLLNVPIGAYDADNLANMGFNRWAVDVHGAFTWLDPNIGFEVSSNAGFTFNWENPDTDYKTGTEFHVEFALMKHFSKELQLGLVGYHYQQVTGDSGAGATLGPFKGRITGLGPSLNYHFDVRDIPVSTSLRWYRELNADNRPDGDAVYLQASFPLSGSQH